MEDFDDNMYRDDDEPVPASASAPRMHSQRNGRIVEVTIDGSNISVPDASFVREVLANMNNMHAQIQRLAQDLRTVRSRLSNAEMEIRRLTAEMDKKIGYE